MEFAGRRIHRDPRRYAQYGSEFPDMKEQTVEGGTGSTNGGERA